MRQLETLLHFESLQLDNCIDYMCGIFENDVLVATGSCCENTLRCFAVKESHKGTGLLNTVLTHLLEIQNSRGNSHVFLYTKPESEKFFSNLGFYTIKQIENLVFMENRRTGFKDFCFSLEKTARTGNCAAIVMNANPFTYGHRYIVEMSARRFDCVHVFVLSQDSSFFPADVRFELVMKGLQDIDNVILHKTESYMISNATFPSYFLKDEDDVVIKQALLDCALFSDIAKSANVRTRVFGEENTSRVTELYNKTASQYLENYGIECSIIKRLCRDEKPVSASTVRKKIHDNDFAGLEKLVPPSTLDYLMSDRALNVIDNIRNSNDVVHY